MARQLWWEGVGERWWLIIGEGGWRQLCGLWWRSNGQMWRLSELNSLIKWVNYENKKIIVVKVKTK